MFATDNHSYSAHNVRVQVNELSETDAYCISLYRAILQIHLNDLFSRVIKNRIIRWKINS